MSYNYRMAMKEDIMEYIEQEGLSVTTSNRDQMEEMLNDDLFVTDSVTGNASGSYTFNRLVAQDYVTQNIDLCAEAVKEFGCDSDETARHFLDGDWEWFDVTIRCYLLGECLAEVLDEIEKEDDEEEK